MPRLNVIKVGDATGKVKEMYDSVSESVGMVPNLLKGLANSPVALQACLALDDLISEGKLADVEQEMVRLVISQFLGCEYCLAFHTMVAKTIGLAEEQILDIRRGRSDDPKSAALIVFTHRVLETEGLVDDVDIATFRAAGYTDAHIAEVITIIAMQTLTSYFSNVNDTELDFPKAPDI